MAKAKKAAKEVLKWKKKKWVPILAPAVLHNAPVGESFVLDPNTLVGKTVESKPVSG
jgi:ribosomal protein S3AE